jgi:peptidyl-prolyl cis-trans isomerase C
MLGFAGFRRLAAASLLLCGLGLASPLAAQGSDPPDPVVATVDGHKIHLSELIAIYRALPQRMQQMNFEQLYLPLVDHAISVRLLSAEGRKQKLQESDAVKRQLLRYEDTLVYQAYTDKVVTEKATEPRLKTAYEKFVKEFKGEEEIRASHILVKTEQEAKDIIIQIEKGGDFEKIAKEKSIDPSKAQNSGDLGYFAKEQMVKEFAEAAFAMKKGETSKAPVKTQFGWHVIRVTDRRTKAAPPFDEVKDQLRQEMAQEIAGEEVKRLRAAAKVERFDAKGQPIKEEEKK